MKLWKKISIICSIVLVVIVATCSTLLLLQSKNSILEITYQQARDKQQETALAPANAPDHKAFELAFFSGVFTVNSGFA